VFDRSGHTVVNIFNIFLNIYQEPHMALTKADLIETIQSNNGLTQKQNADIVEATIAIIKDTLASGEDVLISGFGKLCVKHKAERKGRNPATGEDLMQPARRVVTFRCSGKLRDKVNKNEGK
jgi:integration host factor subunit alpha